MSYLVYTHRFKEQLAARNIDKKNIVWNRGFLEGYSDSPKTFIDKSTGWAYNVEANDTIVGGKYFMDYNMYETNCWQCGNELGENRHTKRCFFCRKCCQLKIHPDPHL